MCYMGFLAHFPCISAYLLLNKEVETRTKLKHSHAEE
jgi:hypothetical protein